MKNTKTTFVVLATLLIVSTGGVYTIGVASAQTGNTTTATPTANETTTTTDVQTTEQTATPTPTSTETPATTTKSVEEQVADGVEDGIEDATNSDSGDEKTDEKQNKNCIEVTAKTGDTTTKQCIPHHYQKIDNSTAVVAVDWDSEVVTIVIKSETPQRITITDPYSVDKSKQGGKVSFVDETLSSGRNVVRMRATEKGGDKELWIGTDDDLGYISNPETPFLANGLKTSLLYMAGIGGGLGTILVIVLYVRYRIRKMQSGWKDVLEDYTP